MISLGVLFYILAAVFAMDSIPKCVEWMFDLDRQLPRLNSAAQFFEKSNILFKISGEIFLFTLKIYIANNCRFF